MTQQMSYSEPSPAEMYAHGYRFSFHDQQWIYPTDTVSQRELSAAHAELLEEIVR